MAASVASEEEASVVAEGTSDMDNEFKWTVGKLVKALEFMKDDTPITISLNCLDNLDNRNLDKFMLCGSSEIVIEVFT